MEISDGAFRGFLPSRLLIIEDDTMETKSDEKSKNHNKQVDDDRFDLIRKEQNRLHAKVGQFKQITKQTKKVLGEATESLGKLKAKSNEEKKAAKPSKKRIKQESIQRANPELASISKIVTLAKANLSDLKTQQTKIKDQGEQLLKHAVNHNFDMEGEYQTTLHTWTDLRRKRKKEKEQANIAIKAKELLEWSEGQQNPQDFIAQNAKNELKAGRARLEYFHEKPNVLHAPKKNLKRKAIFGSLAAKEAIRILNEAEGSEASPLWLANENILHKLIAKVVASEQARDYKSTYEEKNQQINKYRSQEDQIRKLKKWTEKTAKNQLKGLEKTISQLESALPTSPQAQ